MNLADINQTMDVYVCIGLGPCGILLCVYYRMSFGKEISVFQMTESVTSQQCKCLA